MKCVTATAFSLSLSLYFALNAIEAILNFPSEFRTYRSRHIKNIVSIHSVCAIWKNKERKKITQNANNMKVKSLAHRCNSPFYFECSFLQILFSFIFRALNFFFSLIFAVIANVVSLLLLIVGCSFHMCIHAIALLFFAFRQYSLILFQLFFFFGISSADASTTT